MTFSAKMSFDATFETKAVGLPLGNLFWRDPIPSVSGKSCPDVVFRVFLFPCSDVSSKISLGSCVVISSFDELFWVKESSGSSSHPILEVAALFVLIYLLRASYWTVYRDLMNSQATNKIR